MSALFVCCRVYKFLGYSTGRQPLQYQALKMGPSHITAHLPLLNETPPPPHTHTAIPLPPSLPPSFPIHAGTPIRPWSDHNLRIHVTFHAV